MTTARNDPTVPPLSREVIVDTALELADADGIDALSLRRLAGTLGVTPMALYRYVAGKDELLGAMMDRVFADFELPAPRGDWREDLRAFGRAFRRLLLRHPAAGGLYLARVETIFVNGLRIVEVLLAVLESAGFTPEEAVRLENSLERNVLALVLFENDDADRLPPEEQAARVEHLRGRLLALPHEQFPHTLDVVDQLCAAVDPGEAFEFSLDLLIAGLEQLLERRRR